MIHGINGSHYNWSKTVLTKPIFRLFKFRVKPQNAAGAMKCVDPRDSKSKESSNSDEGSGSSPQWHSYTKIKNRSIMNHLLFRNAHCCHFPDADVSHSFGFVVSESESCNTLCQKMAVIDTCHGSILDHMIKKI